MSTAVSIGLSPVFTGLWTAVRSRRRLSVVWVVGTAIAMGGLLLLAFGGGHEVPVSVSGLVLAVLAALCFSMQVSSIQTLATRHGDATALTAMFAVGAVALIPVTVLTATSNLIAAGNAFWILYLGVVTTGVAYWLFSRGVRHVGAAAGTTISLLEPVAAAVIAAVALNEAVSLAQWIGIVAICAAVLAISFRPTFSVREADQLVEEFA